MTLAFDAPAAGARRHQHDLHRAARDRLLRRQVGASTRRSRPTPAWRGRSQSRRPKARILNCVHPAAVNGRLQTCQRVADLILGALAQAVPERRHGLLELGLHRRLLHRPAAERRLDLGLSRDDRRRQRRARPQGRAGRRARPHDQHLEPAGRGAGDRISAAAAALRAGRRTPAASASIAAAWACGASTRRPTTAASASTSRASARGAGACSAAAPARTARSRPARASYSTGDSAVLKTGQWFALVTPGAGGFGPPDAARACGCGRDLAEGAISAPTARDIYGVSR